MRTWTCKECGTDHAEMSPAFLAEIRRFSETSSAGYYEGQLLEYVDELTRQRDDARRIAIDAGAFTDERDTYRRAILADEQIDAYHDALFVFGGLTYPLNVALWDAVGEYAEECADDARRIALEQQ